MFPVLLIAIGVAALLFGRKTAVLGAAVGMLMGFGLLRLFPGSDPSLEVWVPIGLAIVGALCGGFIKGIEPIVLLVLGALAGAAIVLELASFFPTDFASLTWLLAVIGGVVGLILVRRYKDWSIIVLASLVGALLVRRGLSDWLPGLEGAIGTVLVLALAGGGTAYQGRSIEKPKEDSAAPIPAPTTAAANGGGAQPGSDSQSTPPTAK